MEYSLLSTIGGGMMESGNYVNNHIASKCSELERILASLNQAFDNRIDFLSTMHEILLDIEEVFDTVKLLLGLKFLLAV